MRPWKNHAVGFSKMNPQDSSQTMSDLHFLFLQGLPSPFFSRIAKGLTSIGCKATGVNFCVGDQMFWRGPNTVNYRGKLSDWPRFIANFLDENHVTDIVLLGEQRSYHKVAIEAASKRNIRVTVTDFGYLRPDWITLERDGMGGNSRFPKDPDTMLKLASILPHADLARRYTDSFWTMAINDMLYHLSNLFFGWLFPFYIRPYKRDNPVLHYPSIGIRLLFSGTNNRKAERVLSELKSRHAKYFLFPLQLENDFQIIAYSPFENMEEAVRVVIKSFAENAQDGTRLLVKLHPLEPGLKNWKKLIYSYAREFGIEERIDFIDGGNLEEIIDGSSGMITVNSTAGIHALRLGSPVKVLGQAIYDIAGLTYQGNLDEYWKDARKPDMELVGAFIKAIAHTVMIRGVFYSEPGLNDAVCEAVALLYEGRVGAHGL